MDNFQNHIHFYHENNNGSSQSSPTVKSKSKRWPYLKFISILIAATTSITVAYIKRPHQSTVTDKEPLVPNSLLKTNRELEDIKERINSKNYTPAEYLILSSDSLAHVIRINLIKEQLNKQS